MKLSVSINCSGGPAILLNFCSEFLAHKNSEFFSFARKSCLQSLFKNSRILRYFDEFWIRGFPSPGCPGFGFFWRLWCTAACRTFAPKVISADSHIQQPPPFEYYDVCINKKARTDLVASVRASWFPRVRISKGPLWSLRFFYAAQNSVCRDFRFRF